MRIIAGSRRGRRLVEWEEDEIRPMRDVVRGALFSIIADFVRGASFLDLFCGTGSAGLEALSRGAKFCTFVDRSRVACGIVRRNLAALEFLAAAEVIESGCVEAVDLFARRGRRFDLVFLDPPYDRGLVPVALAALADGRILGGDPVVVAAMGRREEAGATYGVLFLVDQRRYGDNRLLFYRRRGADSVDGGEESVESFGEGDGAESDSDHQR